MPFYLCSMIESAPSLHPRTQLVALRCICFHLLSLHRSMQKSTLKAALSIGAIATVVVTALVAHRRARNKRPPPRTVDEKEYKFPREQFRLSQYARRLFTEYAKLINRTDKTLTDDEI